jgi:hypothetical protein
MTNTEARTAELTAMTAKALRPIAADLGITGSSRMKKDEIVAAIVAAEEANAVPSAFVAEDGVTPTTVAELWEKGLAAQDDAKASEQAPRIAKHSHWAMSYPLAKGGDGNVMQGHADYCATWGHATEKSTDLDGVITIAGHCPRCGDLLPKADVPADLCAHGIDVTRRCSICRAADVEEAQAEAVIMDQDRSIYRWVTSVPVDVVTDWSAVVAYADERRPHFTAEQWAGIAGKADGFLREQAPAPKFKMGDQFVITGASKTARVELIDLDPSGGPGFAWRARLVARVGGECAEGTVTEDFLQQPYVSKVEADRYFARQTRMGTETVVVERERAGRVAYRIINPTTGRRSGIYQVREGSFYGRYTPVPA